MFNQNILGSTIDNRYKIIALVGQGGMGAVYKALEIGLERELALKFMHVYHLNDSESRSRFEREGKVLSSLKHRNIVATYRFGIWNNQIPYLAMEYLQGETLRETLDKEIRMLPKRALSIGIQLCDALEYAHHYGVIHRDIKPGNIIILDQSETDFVKIVDFGLMRLLPEAWQVSQKLTQTGLLIGTAQYFCPEQCLGNQTDQRSDLYSLAVVIYECITGCMPFNADNPIGIMHKHANEMPVAPSEILAGQPLPEGLDFVLMKALQKDPALRYQSASEFQEALTSVQSGQGKALSEESSELQPWKTTKRISKIRLSTTLTTAALALAALFFAGLSIQKFLPIPTPRNQSVPANTINTERLREAEKLSLEAVQNFKQKKMSRSITLSVRTLTTLSLISRDKTASAEERRKELAILERLHSILLTPGMQILSINNERSLYDLALRYQRDRQLEAEILIAQIKGRIAEQEGNLHGQLSVHGDLTRLYIGKGNLPAAKEELAKQEKLIEQCDIKVSLDYVRYLQEKSDITYITNKRQLKEARSYLHQAFEILQQLADQETFEKIMEKDFTIGSRAARLEDLPFAEKVLLFGRDFILHHEAGRPKNLIPYDRLLIKIYKQLGRYSEAKKYCLEEIEICHSLPDVDMKAQLLKQAQEAFAEIENLSKNVPVKH